MTQLSEREVRRQYRVIKQTLSMHADLRDHYSRASCLAQIITVVASTLVCAMTFASDQLYSMLGVSAPSGKMVVGFAGIAAFAASLALLVLDWRGRATEHREAAKLWSRALREFRTRRTEDKTWLSSTWDELNALYWRTSQYSVEVPSGRFNGLKGRYLRKVLISRLQSRYPGSPLFLIWLKIRLWHVFGALRHKAIDLTHDTQS
jgi:hypothetical protein